MRANHISTLGFLCSHFQISSSGHFQISFVCYRFPVSLRQIFFPSLFSPVIPGTQSKMCDNTKTYKQHSQISPRPPRCVHRNTFCSTWKKALRERQVICITQPLILASDARTVTSSISSTRNCLRHMYLFGLAHHNHHDHG